MSSAIKATNTASHDDDHHGPTKGMKRWFFTTNHKDIGTMYLVMSLFLLFLSGSMALLIRLELFEPGTVFMKPEFYNQMITFHGLVMVFGVIMPAMAGLANWMIPLMIGAPDMAFPRLNNWSFWLLPFAFALLTSTLFMKGAAPDFGWTFYAPLSTTYGPDSTDFFIFSVHMMGISSILASINIIVTLFNMRAPGMTWMKMPMFCWGWLITAFLLLAVMPALAGCVTMMLFDRHFHTSFFDAAGGGDPLLFQHLFWFFGHPEVYILILPGFGIISQVIPTFSRKKLFGYRFMVYATAVIAIMGFLVWMHHMFTTGAPLVAQLFFMYTTMLVAVPTGIKVFNWVATIYKGSVSFETPMLFALGFLVLFTIGGFSGLMLSIAPADYQYRDSYFVVAHFHYVLVSGALFAIISGIYYWLPKWTGHIYNEKIGQWHFWLTVVGMNLTFWPMHYIGLAGMPRRIPDYALQFTLFNQMATVGSFLFGFAQLLFLYVIWQSMFRSNKKAPARVWDGAEGLEWTVPSPAPYHTFEEPPTHIE
ncbi:MAG: cytochrome c oxidase subunit I [Gammaproteobacteria bacterium]